VLAHGLLIDRHYLIVYDEPGRVAEISVATAEEPKIQGDYVYNYWDQEYEALVVGVQVEKTEKILVINNHLLLVVMPRARALQSWTAEFPSKLIPGAEEPKPMVVPFLTDAYQLAASGSTKKMVWVELDFQPGEHTLTMLLPPTPAKTRVDGVLVTPQYERPIRTAHLNLSTPPVPYPSIALNQVETWTEKFDPAAGEWRTGPLRPLEELGEVPYGYVKYRGQFAYAGEPVMSITSFGTDFKRVFLNGKPVPEASNGSISFEFSLAKYAVPGSNLLEIACESFGSSSGGPNLGALRGIDSVRYGRSAQDVSTVADWKIQRFPPARRGREIDQEFSSGGWKPADLNDVATSKELVPAFTWCRAEFALPSAVPGWSAPWKVAFEAARDALLYLNGKFIGRYVTAGPQKDFFLPEAYFVTGAKTKNILTVMLAYADHPGYIRTLRVGPYEEFSAHRTRIEFEW